VNYYELAWVSLILHIKTLPETNLFLSPNSPSDIEQGPQSGDGDTFMVAVETRSPFEAVVVARNGSMDREFLISFE
jgi:hypothetical protein